MPADFAALQAAVASLAVEVEEQKVSVLAAVQRCAARIDALAVMVAQLEAGSVDQAAVDALTQAIAAASNELNATQGFLDTVEAPPPV